MDIVLSEDGNEQPTTLPFTPEMVGTINGLEPSTLKSEHLRKIRRILSDLIDGCVVIVVDGGVIDTIYQVKQFKIGPAEK